MPPELLTDGGDSALTADQSGVVTRAVRSENRSAVQDAVAALEAGDREIITWSALGTGMNAVVWGCRALSSGTVIAMGDCTTAGESNARYAAQWNGSRWVPIGMGFDGAVLASVKLPNGDLVVVGSFRMVAGVATSGIARWNGTAWSAIGPGLQGGDVHALAVWSNGDLVAGGAFTSAGGSPTDKLARSGRASVTCSSLS